MSGMIILVIAVGVIVFIALAISAAFLQISCCICRVETPGFRQAMWIAFMNGLACVVVSLIGVCLIGLIAFGAGVKDVQGLRMQIGIVTILITTLVSAVVYSWMIPTSFRRGILIGVAQYVIGIVLGMLTVPLLPPNVRQAIEQRQAGGPVDTVAIRNYLNRMNAQWETAKSVPLLDSLENMARAQTEAERSKGTVVSLSSTWRLLEIKDMGNTLTKEGMLRTATSGKFVLVAYQGPARAASSSQVVYSPTLVDSQGRQFKPINNSMFYLPEGLRFMTLERLASGAVEIFHSIYEVAVDSQGLFLQGQRPTEGSGKKTPL